MSADLVAGFLLTSYDLVSFAELDGLGEFWLLAISLVTSSAALAIASTDWPTNELTPLDGLEIPDLELPDWGLLDWELLDWDGFEEPPLSTLTLLFLFELSSVVVLLGFELTGSCLPNL